MQRSPDQVDSRMLSRVALQLFDEAYRGPADPRSTWFVDNEPESGFFGTLRGLSAEAASTPLAPGGATVAAHAAHLRYALSLANRAMQGQNPYPGADWPRSWSPREVTPEQWSELAAQLEREIEEFRRRIEDGSHWTDENLAGALLAQIAHGAWHLGAIRQGLDRVRMPGG